MGEERRGGGREGGGGLTAEVRAGRHSQLLPSAFPLRRRFVAGAVK